MTSEDYRWHLSRLTDWAIRDERQNSGGAIPEGFVEIWFRRNYPLLGLSGPIRVVSPGDYWAYNQQGELEIIELEGRASSFFTHSESVRKKVTWVICGKAGPYSSQKITSEGIRLTEVWNHIQPIIAEAVTSLEYLMDESDIKNGLPIPLWRR